jgi:SSS family solute:Na+ symporter
MLGWNIAGIIIITGVSVMVYSLLGGIQAVLWTDAIQGVVLIVGAIVCSLVLIFSMPEGPAQIFTIAMTDNKFSLGSFNISLSDSTFWVVLIYGLFINLQNYGIDQNYVQRYMTASSDKDAKKSALLGGLLYVPVSLIFFFIGTALYSYYAAVPGILPEEIASDKVFPFFIVNHLPVGLTGLLVASIFAAGMSTISTSVNSSATVIFTDYFGNRPGIAKDEPRRMRILYISSFMFALLSIAVALAMMNVESILEAWWSLASVFSGGMLGLFLLGFAVQKVNRGATIAGVAAGVCVIAWMSLSPLLFGGSLSSFASPFHNYLSIVFGTAAIFLTGFFLTIIRNAFQCDKNHRGTVGESASAGGD